MKSILTTTALLLFTLISFSQKDEIVFIKKVPIKLQSSSLYTFYVRYEATKDCDIAIDFYGGPNNFWAGKTIPVKKGKGHKKIEIYMNESPKPGNGYTISAAIRKRGGNRKTTTAATSINNIQITKRSEEIIDDASFSHLSPIIISNQETVDFKIKYKASQERKIVVTVHNNGLGIGTSETISVQKGIGTKEIQVKMSSPPKGNKYKFTLYYGSEEGFPNKYIISKTITDIRTTKRVKKVETTPKPPIKPTPKPQETINVKDSGEKSITLSLNKESNILTLPGKSSYTLIQIITSQGQLAKEAKNSNSIEVSDLPKGNYVAITSENDYYQFVKF
ncbi:hypothetical protein [Aquimarina algiphila]|uniref:hypothetical protein n=1 Tax=Aquimarina algiphila TaxID=2047982 RepID=UPI0023301B3D|nr:hypothetical protein [Aquimarina algiphila]